MTNFLNFCFFLWLLFFFCFPARAMYVQLHVKYLICSDQCLSKKVFHKRETQRCRNKNSGESSSPPPPLCTPVWLQTTPKALSVFLLDTQGKTNTRVRQRRLQVLKDSRRTIHVYLSKDKKLAQEPQVSSGNIPFCTWWGFNNFRHHRPPWEVRCGCVSTLVKTCKCLDIAEVLIPMFFFFFFSFSLRIWPFDSIHLVFLYDRNTWR